MNTDSSNRKKYAIGIDLGTSNSSAFVYIDDKPVMITSDGVNTASKMLPSCVAILKNGQVIVGDAAKNQMIASPERVVYQAKRYMGTDKVWQIDKQEYRPEQIAAYILRKIKSDAQKQLGGTVEQVVVTVPAQFNDAQRVATMDAIKIAGLKPLRLINEPTAAAISYQNTESQEHTVLVVDIGGGTTDETLLSVSNGVYDVINTGGDTQIGGLDIDKAFMDYIVEKIQKVYGEVPTSDKTVYERLRTAAENAKIELSTLLTTNIILPFLYKSQKEDIVSVNIPVQRSELETVMQKFVKKIQTITKEIIDSNNCRGKISKLILVGGPTQAPLLKSVIEQEVGVKAEMGINPNHCVSIGAARQASMLATDVDNVKVGGSSLLLLDVTPLSLGIEVQNNATSIIIPRNSKIPTSKSQKYTTAKDGQTEVYINILQGERYKATDNHSIGMLHVKEIPSHMKRGQPIIEVIFEINSDGILTVSAFEQTTKNKVSIDIQSANKLDKSKIDQMIETAQKNEQADQDYKDKVQTIHNAKSLINRTDELGEQNKMVQNLAEWPKLVELVAELKKTVVSDVENVDIIKLKQQVKLTESQFGELMNALSKLAKENEKDNTNQENSDDSDEQSKTETDFKDTETDAS